MRIIITCDCLSLIRRAEQEGIQPQTLSEFLSRTIATALEAGMEEIAVHVRRLDSEKEFLFEIE